MFTPTFYQELDALLAKHSIARSQRGDKIILASEDAGRNMLRYYGRNYGLEEQDFGAEFVSQGKRWKLVGLKPSRPKYPLEVECVRSGTVYKFTTSVVPQIVAQRSAAQTAAPVAAKPAAAAPVVTQDADQDDRYATAAIWG